MSPWASNDSERLRLHALRPGKPIPLRSCSPAIRALCPPLAALLVLSLNACVAHRGPRLGPSATQTREFPNSVHHGRAYVLLPRRSRLTVLVYRAGPLAALGHNHVIDCRCLSGVLYVPHDMLATKLLLRIPVDDFVVDAPARRAAQHSSAFPPDVSAAARHGTRLNMLSDAVLDAAAYPVVIIRSERLQRTTSDEPHALQAHVHILLRGNTRSITVPVRYTITRGRLVVTGHFALKQTTLGLRPFSVLFGALRVKNRLRVRFRLVAVPAASAPSTSSDHSVDHSPHALR